jgi:hypothetical protein
MIDIHAKTSKQKNYTMSQLTHTKQIENISFTYAKWIQENVTMDPSINVSINFNEFIKKNMSCYYP